MIQLISQEELKKAELAFRELTRILHEEIIKLYFLGLTEPEINKIELKYAKEHPEYEKGENKKHGIFRLGA